MLKMVFLVVRRHGMDIESFREYYARSHRCEPFPDYLDTFKTTPSRARAMVRRHSTGLRRCGGTTRTQGSVL